MKSKVPVVLMNAIFFYFILNPKLMAQPGDAEYTYTGGVGVFKGFLMAQSSYASYLTTARPGGFNFFLEKNTFGSKFWESTYNYPSYGLSFFYFNTNQPELGDLLSGIIFTCAPMR